jgi:ABC-type nitrate/sulfonate/bicarbonate transport system permease component
MNAVVSANGRPSPPTRRSPDAQSPEQRALRRQRRESWLAWLVGSCVLLSVLAVWTWLSASSRVPNGILPSPRQVFETLLRMIASGELWANVKASLFRVIVGFSIGAGLSVVVGSLIGWFKWVSWALNPLVEMLRPIPPLAFIPLIIIWFGIGEDARVLVIAIAAFLTCIVPVRSGMRETPEVYVDAAMTLGASPLRVFTTVAIPSTIPFIFAGLRVALAASWTTLVAAELVAAQSGVGYMIQNGSRFFLTDVVLAGVAVIGVLAFMMDKLAQLALGWLTRWSEIRR